MLATVSSSAKVATSDWQKEPEQPDYWPSVVLIAAGVALIIKLLIAWTTFGTNDVAAFYRFGKSLSETGLQATYVHEVAFNHPPLVAFYLRHIYELDHLPWLHDHGIAFPFLLRLPGIIADFITVAVMLSIRRTFRLPVWTLLILALSPVSIMVSGFHGNTDSVMVLLLVLAASACVWDRPILCGLFLAGSTQIKIVPLLFVPIFFLYWGSRRKIVTFNLTFGLTLALMWIEPLLNFCGVFLHRVLFYGGFWGLWGITYWLRLTGVEDFELVSYHDFLPLQQLVATFLKLGVVLAVLLLAWRRRQLDAHELFGSLAWAWVSFFILSPGVGPQYLVWPMPFLLVLSPTLFAWFTATSSLLLFLFYNTIAHGLPWFVAISAGSINDRWIPWTTWPWLTLIAGAFLLRHHLLSRTRPGDSRTQGAFGT